MYLRHNLFNRDIKITDTLSLTCILVVNDPVFISLLPFIFEVILVDNDWIIYGYKFGLCFFYL